MWYCDGCRGNLFHCPKHYYAFFSFEFAGENQGPDFDEDPDQSSGRFVRYQFTPTFLKLKTIGAM